MDTELVIKYNISKFGISSVIYYLKPKNPVVLKCKNCGKNFDNRASSYCSTECALRAVNKNDLAE